MFIQGTKCITKNQDVGVVKMSSLRQRDLTTINLPKEGSFIVKDYRGFTVAQITETGDIKRKGDDVKL